MLAKHSNLLPIQPSRASSLLPSLLGGTCSQTRRVTPAISTAVIDFLQSRLNFYRFCPFQGILRTLWKVVCHSFVKSLVFDDHQTYRKMKQNSFFKPTPHSPYMRLAVSLEMDRTVKIHSCLVYRQKNQILRSK